MEKCIYIVGLATSGNAATWNLLSDTHICFVAKRSVINLGDSGNTPMTFVLKISQIDDCIDRNWNSYYFNVAYCIGRQN